MGRPTWVTSGTTCDNCGKGLMEHENQVFCPLMGDFSHLRGIGGNLVEFTREMMRLEDDQIIRDVEAWEHLHGDK